MQDYILFFFIWAMSGIEPYIEWLFKICWLNRMTKYKSNVEMNYKNISKSMDLVLAPAIVLTTFGHLFIQRTLIITYFMLGS